MSTVTEKKLREKIEADLTVIPEENLLIISEFIDFIKSKNCKQINELNNINKNLSDKEIRVTPADGKGYLRHAGKWVGDDLQECLDKVYENRGKVKINNRINPFK